MTFGMVPSIFCVVPACRSINVLQLNVCIKCQGNVGKVKHQGGALVPAVYALNNFQIIEYCQ